MSWENFGNRDGQWSVDHWMPLLAEQVDLHNPSHQKAVCHFTNLRPLWHTDNVRKGNSVFPEAKRHFKYLLKTVRQELREGTT